MTREEARQAAEVMMAYAEGKEIELNGRSSCGCQMWEETSDPTFNWYDFMYRTKTKPKYRPFKTLEECWEEMHKHPDFGWLYYKDKGYYVNINAMGDRVGMNGQKFVEAYSDYTFTDGEPFGVKEEQL